MHFIILDLLPLYEQGNLIDAYRFALDKARMGADAQHLIDRFAELETIPFARIVAGGNHHAAVSFESTIGEIALRSG